MKMETLESKIYRCSKSSMKWEGYSKTRKQENFQISYLKELVPKEVKINK